MSTNRRANFGIPVQAVAAGFYPFEIQIWAFAGEVNAQNGDWIVNFQGYARKMSGQNDPDGGNGYINDFATACLFKTNNHSVNIYTASHHELQLHYQANNLPIDFHINTVHSNGLVDKSDTIRYQVGPSAFNGSPMAISLVDVEVGSTLKLLGSTEVVVVDPIF